MELTLKQRATPYDKVQVEGLFAARMRLSLDKLMRMRQMHTRYADWGADQIGRWISSTTVQSQLLAPTYDASTRGQYAEAIRSKVDELIAAQDEDGLFYGERLRPAPDRWRHVWFGHGRGIWALLESWHTRRDPAVLAALVRAADCAVAQRERWVISNPLCGGIESVTGAMAILGRELGRDDYVAYARSMADGIEKRIGPPVAVPRAHVDPTSLPPYIARDYGHHTHSYLSTAHGIVELALATGEEQYLLQAAKVWSDALSTVWANGDMSESFTDLYERCDETCSVVDWMVLGLKLYAVTGEARYLHAVELSTLNHMLWSQEPQGGYTCYRCLNRHHWMRDKNWGGEQSECCAMSGGWGLGQVVSYAVTANAEGLSVNLPIDVTASVPWQGGQVHVTQRLRLGTTHLLHRVHVRNSSSQPLAIQVRIPCWCDAPTLRIDGQAQPLRLERGFAHVPCAAGADQELELELPMRLTVIPARSSYLTRTTAGAEGDAAEEALQYGPFVLMFYREMNPQITTRDLGLTLRLDSAGRPPVRYQDLPEGWTDGGIPLFIEAELEDGSPVLLTPCANTTMRYFSVSDPYVLRFARVTLVSHG